MTKKGLDLSNNLFDVMQFASAYGYSSLYLHLHSNYPLFFYSPKELTKLFNLVRLANLTKKELLKMMPKEKKNQTRMQLYQKARKRLEND